MKDQTTIPTQRNQFGSILKLANLLLQLFPSR